MESALRLTTTVRPGGRIEVSDPELPDGACVDLIVLLAPLASAPRRSIVDVLAEAPGALLFRTPADVDDYLGEERDAWEH